MNDMQGVAIYPVMTLIIFFAIFSVMLVKVMLRKKSDDALMSALPLDKEEIHG